MSPLAEVALQHLAAGSRNPRLDWVIEELPVALVYNGMHYAVMMTTPQDLVDFAFGFSFTEGIISRHDELRVIEIVERNDGIVIEMALDAACAQQLEARRRNLLGASGCGICGSAALAQLSLTPPTVRADPRISLSEIETALAKMQAAQSLNQRAGGVHAAAAIHAGSVIVREDVGRHNALDKLLGYCLHHALTPDFVVLSSRASFELVHKVALANIAVLVAISAPTAMAVRSAQACGLTLAAFARDQQMNLYSRPERIVATASAG